MAKKGHSFKEGNTTFAVKKKRTEVLFTKKKKMKLY